VERFNSDLFNFLDASPTPFHAVSRMRSILLEAGFEELHETVSWSLREGMRYFCIRNGSSLIAFTYPKMVQPGYLLLGAHTDSPNLKIKPNPIQHKEGVTQLAVEPYGGVLINPWFDRELSIAGKVVGVDAQGKVCESLVDLEAPVAIIPSLAIHLDPTANKERSVNLQTDIAPLLTCNEKFDFDAMLKKASNPELASVLSYELSLYDVQRAGYVGFERDFIASARLDNLLSCFVNLQTLLQADPESAVMIFCSDHEEVGSESSSGAAGPFLEQLLRRLYANPETYTQMIRNSLMVSCDNAHAAHPNFSEKHEPGHKPRMNGGAVIKINANQRYASNAFSIARFAKAAQDVDVAIQRYVTRSDMGCGSTIGPITATRLGIETVDVGLPTLAMHSIRELAGSKDAFELVKILLKLSRG